MIPKKVTILGEVWTIKIHPELIHDPEDDSYNEGECDPDTMTIHVSLVGNPLRTFIHEFIHAVAFGSAIHQTSMSDDLMEIICEQVSIAMDKNDLIKKK